MDGRRLTETGHARLCERDYDTAGVATRSVPADQAFTVLAINCTHLGCPVNWRGDADLFMCPCHGGVYYSDGTVAGGPPPRPLFQHETRLQAGQLQVRTRPLGIG